MSSSTPTGNTPDSRQTASMLSLVERLSLPTRNATFSDGLPSLLKSLLQTISQLFQPES